MRILPIFLALSAWAASFLVMNSYSEATWQCLSSLILVDALAMFAFMSARVHYVVARWVSAILFISIVVTSMSALLMYSYQNFTMDVDFVLLVVFSDYYQAFGFVMSALVLIVSAIPPKIASALDGLYWPVFANSIRYGCDIDRTHNSKRNP